MKTVRTLPMLSISQMILLAVTVVGAVSWAYLAGSFWRVPPGIRTGLTAGVSFSQMSNLMVDYVLAMVAYKGCERLLVMPFGLGKSRGLFRKQRSLLRAAAKGLSLFVGVAIFAFAHLGLGVSVTGLGVFVCACISVPVLFASEHLILAIWRLRSGRILRPKDVRALMRGAKTAAVMLVVAAFLCGDLRTGYVIRYAEVHSVEEGVTRNVWASGHGQIKADFYGNPWDLRKTVNWSLHPWEGRPPERVSNTTDLLARDTLNALRAWVTAGH